MTGFFIRFLQNLQEMFYLIVFIIVLTWVFEDLILSQIYLEFCYRSFSYSRFLVSFSFY